MKVFKLMVAFFLMTKVCAAEIHTGILEAEGLALNVKLQLATKKDKKKICFDKKWINLAKFKGITFNITGSYNVVSKCIAAEKFEPIKTRSGNTVLKGILMQDKDGYHIKDGEQIYHLGKIPNYMTKLKGKKVLIGVKQSKKIGKKDQRYSIFSVREYPY